MSLGGGLDARRRSVPAAERVLRPAAPRRTLPFEDGEEFGFVNPSFFPPSGPLSRAGMCVVGTEPIPLAPGDCFSFGFLVVESPAAPFPLGRSREGGRGRGTHGCVFAGRSGC